MTLGAGVGFDGAGAMIVVSRVAGSALMVVGRQKAKYPIRSAKSATTRTIAIMPHAELSSSL